MSQSGRPHDAIGVIDLPLELELRLWEMRSVLNNRLLAAFWNHLLFRLWGIDGNGGGFRPAGELVKRDILPKVREGREDVRYYIPRAQTTDPWARRSATRNGQGNRPHPAHEPCPFL